MVYCHECGSEIAEIDTFCPFCGISIQPVKIGGSDSEMEDDLTTSDVKDSDDSSIEVKSVGADGESKSSDSDDDGIDMSETIVVKKESPQEVKDNDDSLQDGAYIDIASLKDDDEKEEVEQEATKAKDIDEEEFLTTDQIGNDEAEESINDETESIEVKSDIETEADTNNDEVVSDDTATELTNSSSYLDVSENQDDIEELLDDDSNDDIEYLLDNDSTENEKVIEETSQVIADEKAIDVVTEIVEETNKDEVAADSTASAEPIDKIEETAETADVEEKVEIVEEPVVAKDSNKPPMTLEEKVSAEIAEQVSAAVDKVPPVSTTVDESDIKETPNDEVFNNDSSNKMPADIQSADDSEIDDALSVIDSKALAWKKNDDGSKTPSTLEATEQVEPVNVEPETIVEKEIEQTPVQETPVKETTIVEKKEEVVEVREESSASTDVSAVPNEVSVQPESVNVVEESVSIVDSQPEQGESEQELANVESAPQQESVNVESPVAVNIANESQSEDSPSPTTPNMGVVDTDGNKSTKLKPIDEGVVLNNRYEIVRKIGGGGMGAVYLANDKNLGGVLRAVKEMVQSYIEEEQQEKALNDFKRESMLLTSLEHPSIPTIYDYFYDEKEGRFYLVMKYISGGDLAARLRSAPEGRIDEISVTDWAYQIADVLEYLHTRNPCIVYRDLKPANIMLDGNTNKVMLIDFGIARSINKEEKGVTAVGTMGYAPPELFSGNVQPASDIYSLGSTMFHLLTGADPQSNPLLIFDFQKHPRPRQINPQLSDQMERILMRAVEYNAEKRFSSAAEMRNVLKEHLDNLKAGKISFGIKETPTAVALSDQPVFCGFCGQKIVATDMFCAFCGAKQPLAQSGVHSQEYHIPQVTAKLRIEGTSDLDYPAFELVKNENLLGRRDPMSNIFPEIDLSKFDPQTKISRKHARIWREGDNLMLEDLGSSNGTTWISSKGNQIRLIPNHKQVLQNGDKIQVGDTTLQFISE